MSLPQQLIGLIGNWSGINRLHLPWMTENPIQESETNASIAFSAQGKFIKIEYDWSFEGKKQDGLILFGSEKDSETISSFWIDSWHMNDKAMISKGEANNSAISVLGSYSVPDHPDWGWRTIITSDNQNSFKIMMFNISPDGKEDLAVEAIYQTKK